MSDAHRHRPRGASLLEVIVTVAIVGVLLGMLLPALSAARGAGRATRCRANLRQMAIAAQQYAAFHDRWPPALLYEKRDGAFVTAAWDWVTSQDGRVVETGPLWSFTDNPGDVLQCPEYHGGTNFADPFTGYNYNSSYLGAEERWHPQHEGCIRPGVAPHACRRSAACAMFGDGGRGAGQTNKFMRGPLGAVDHHGTVDCTVRPDPAVIYAGGQAFRHDRHTNVGFVDGHVGPVGRPHRGRDATEALLESVMGFPENGFLSDDDGAYDPR